MCAKNIHGLRSKPKCMNGWKKSPVKTVKYNDSASDRGSSGAINHQRLGKCPEEIPVCTCPVIRPLLFPIGDRYKAKWMLSWTSAFKVFGFLTVDSGI